MTEDIDSTGTGRAPAENAVVAWLNQVIIQPMRAIFRSQQKAAARRNRKGERTSGGGNGKIQRLARTRASNRKRKR